MRRIPCSPGERFGRWTLLSRAEDGPHSFKRWLCRCDCGTERVVYQNILRSGGSRCCGCRGNVTHGMSQAEEYGIWQSIKTRCLNPNDHGFHYYGGRGITICDEWRDSFQAFFDHVGPRPSPLHSIDRKDNNGNYEPGNVWWATFTEQNRNNRNTRLITFRGETRCIAEWGKIFGGERTLVYRRLSRGWSIEKAMTTPVSELHSRPQKIGAQIVGRMR